MKCESRQAYLDGTLSERDQAEFEQHRDECSKCKTEIGRWLAIDTALGAWAQAREEAERPVAEPTSAQAMELLRRADDRQRRARSSRPRWLLPVVSLGTAGVAAVLVGTWWLGYLSPRHPPVQLAQAPSGLEIFTSDGRAEIPAARVAGTHLDTPTDGRMLARLGHDAFGLNRDGAAVLVDASPSSTHILLEHGTLAVQARPRRPGALSIAAGAYIVRVVGTRFLLELTSRDELAVAVTEGVVTILAEGRAQPHRVTHGQRLQLRLGVAPRLSPLPSTVETKITELLTPPIVATSAPQAGTRAPKPSRTLDTPRVARHERAPKPRADYAQWRRWIMQGEYARAETTLTHYVEAVPGDLQAWSLLADCYRKSGKPQEAVDTYRRLIIRGDVVLANRARFLAAVILQDDLNDPRAAAKLLREYLSAAETTRPLEASAKVRLGRCLTALGDVKGAQETLREVARDYAGTPAADEAKALLTR